MGEARAANPLLAAQINELKRLALMLETIIIWCVENGHSEDDVVRCALTLGLGEWMKGVKKTPTAKGRKVTADEEEDIRRKAYRLAIDHTRRRYLKRRIRDDIWRMEDIAVDQEVALQVGFINGEETPLGDIWNGHWKLFSSELFDILEQPVDIRLGTMRFYRSDEYLSDDPDTALWTGVEMALNDAFMVACDIENPDHRFKLPTKSSLRTTGIRMRKPEDGGFYPEWDSWFLFTMLGNGCMKIDIPIETVYALWKDERLKDQKDWDVPFYGVFYPDVQPWH